LRLWLEVLNALVCCEGLSNSNSVSAYGSSDCGGDADDDDVEDDEDDDDIANAADNTKLSCLLSLGISKLTFGGDFLNAILDFVGVRT
jgi:hypothetical protein